MVAAALAVGFGVPAFADAHPGYVPHRMTGVPTFRSSHLVGPIVFTPVFPEATLRQVVHPVTELHFVHGHPPSVWWGRSYHPCTLREAVASLPHDARQFRLATVCHLDRLPVMQSAFEIEDDQLGPTWNTVSFDGSTLNGELAHLAVGVHTLSIVRQVQYRLPKVDTATGETSWEPMVLVLAQGGLPITVQR